MILTLPPHPNAVETLPPAEAPAEKVPRIANTQSVLSPLELLRYVLQTVFGFEKR